MTRTFRVFVAKLRQMSAFTGDSMLDVGCGNGDFTREFGAGFRKVHGIDVQESYLERFRQTVADDEKYTVSSMSASTMTFPDNSFDTVTTLETLEHVPDLAGASREIARVLRPGGELLITVPNRWFPAENHGIKIGSRWIGRVPLLTYAPWLHRRLSQARVFTVGDLDSLFATKGLKRERVDYIWPTFESDGNPFQRLLRPAYGLMRALERSPLRMFGSSVLVKYSKPLQQCRENIGSVPPSRVSGIQ